MKPKTKFKQTEIEMIPEDWEVKELGELAKFQYGLGERAEERGEFVYIRIMDITPDGFLNKNNLAFINKNKVSEEYILKTGDVLIARTGASYGKTYFFREKFQATYGGFLIRLLLNSKMINNNFFFQFSRGRTYWSQANNLVTGGAQPQFNANVISKILVPLPLLPEQRAIAKILSSLDDKIELNQKMNKTLEAIGQAIFKHWFIDFEFPNEQGKPYKSSGGKMIYNEELDKEIPEGWSVGKLGDLISKNRKPIKNYENWKDKDLIDLSNMPQFSMSITTFDKGEKFKSNIFELEEMDILFGSIRPYFGKYGFSPIKGAITGTVYSLKPKKEDYYSFILNVICRREFVDYTVRLSKGTKMPIIGWNDFSNFDIITNKEIIIKFNEIIYPTILKIKNNIEEILSLQKTRDLLLPKLMSGKIRVPVEVK